MANRVAALALALSLAISAFAPGLARAYPENELRALETGNESKVRELRDQELTQLRIALGRRGAANRRADLYLRLAELYLEAYRMEFLLEGRAHEKRLERGVSGAKFIERASSKPYLAAGIKACGEILRLNIRFEKLDQVHYFLGFNYGELGKNAESVKHFEALVRRFPGSAFAGEAWRELGDLSFAQAQFRRAKDQFEAAVRSRKLGDRLPRTLHKLAWTYYRLKMFDSAVSTMKDAIAAAGQDNEKFLSVREEALRDMAVFMTENGRVDEAIAYFQTVAGDKSFYPRVLEKLGRQYERNVEPVKATQVYDSLLRTHPDDEAAFRVRAKLVDLDLRRGLYKQALDRLKGVSIPSGGDTETETAQKNLKAMIRRTATEQHESFRKKGARGALAVAEDFYSAYLNIFLAKDDPRKERPEIQMYLADVKRELGKSKEASEIYRKVLDSGDKRYAKEAGALWTGSLADAIRRQGGQKTGGGTEPSALEKEFVDAADEMQDSLGDVPEGREAALKAAQVLAGYKATHKEAHKRAKKIMATWPKTPQALTAARLHLQLLVDRLPPGSTAEMEKSDAAEELREGIKDLRENLPLLAADQESGGGKLRQQLAEVESRLKVGVIAAQEKDKDYGAAARGYEAFAAETPKREVAEKAYSNAISAWVKLPDFESATRVATIWLKRFPGSRGVVQPLRNTATVALIQGRFDAAAALFELPGRAGVDPDMLQTAARLHEGAGELGKARLAWDAFLKIYPKHPARFAVALSMAQTLEVERQDGAAAGFYKFCRSGSADEQAECGARLADLYARSQDLEAARKLYKEVAAQNPKAARKGTQSSRYVAYARFRLAELLEREARFEPLQLPDAQLKKALNQRLAFLEPLSRAYLSAVEAGGPWGVAGLDRLAGWANSFADEVDSITPPKSADAAAVATFKQSLRSVSAPLRQRAQSTWKDAYEKAVAAELLSPAIADIADRLADQKTLPGRAQGPRGRLRLAGTPADGGEGGRTAALEKVRERLTRNAQDPGGWVDYGNLIWGEARPLLARLCYERALALDPKFTAALNNRGVIAASGSGEEDWLKTAEAQSLFHEALRIDDFFLPAKQNLASVLSYYRLFPKSRPLWDQVVARASSADALDGQAIALQGLGQADAGARGFAKADEAGASSRRFARVFHDAARTQTSQDWKACLDRLEELDEAALMGFEKEATDNLKRTCTAWKQAASTANAQH